MVGRWKSGLAAAIFCFCATQAFAYIIQEPSSALSFDNTAREGDGTFIPNKFKVPGSTNNNASGSIYMGKHDRSGGVDADNHAIADKMLPEPEIKIFNLNLGNDSLRNVRVPLDYIIQVDLPEKENTVWHIDTDESIIKPLSSKLENGVRTLEFLPSRPGMAKIFLDNIAPRNSDIETEPSRILRVKVVK